jgi:hypothetical protein
MRRVSLDPPPRRVARRAAFRLLFGSLPSRLGWLVLVAGLLGLRVAVIAERQESWFRGPLEARAGHVTKQYEVRTGKHKTPTGLYHIEFRYADRPGGPEISSGRSYTRDPGAIPRDGEPVVVEVPVAHPGLARLRGLSLHSPDRAPLAVVVLVPLVFALGGLGYGFVRGRRELRLLVDSRLAPARLERHDPPGFFERKGHLLVFGYEDHRKIPRRLMVQTSFPERCKRGPLVVAHDDSEPPRAVLLAALPGAPSLGDDQVFRDRLAGIDALLSFVLPGVCIAAALVTAASIASGS